MKLAKKTLEEWLVKPPKSAYEKGDGKVYSSKYNTFKSELKQTHEETTKSAILHDIKKKVEKATKDGKTAFNLESILWLNDHGPKHILTVIERATDLVNQEKIDLNVREVYILLNAIQLHDVGNFYGRIGHEKKILEVIQEIIPFVGFDTIEKRYIKNIAQVHGGKIIKENGEKDPNTIVTIKPAVTIDRYNIRKQVLASIVRFADELADDKNRADSKMLFENKIPKSSQIFHAYSFCLDSVIVNHSTETIELHFKIPKEFLLKKLGKIDKEVFLLDEIYDRVLKVHNERIYCSKFWKGLIAIDKIWVQIEFYSRPSENGSLTESDFLVHDDITFTLQDNQYPNVPDDIFSICSELKYPNGKNITGKNLLSKIKDKNE